MNQLPEMLSPEEFHAKFPAVNVSVRTWEYWLVKWRSTKPPKLQRNIHWMIQLRNDVGRGTIVYLPRPVMRLILEDPSSSYFCSQFEGVYGNAIRIYLNGSNTPISTVTIDTTPPSE